MDWLAELRRLHNPDNHPSRNPVITVDGDLIGDLKPVVRCGNTTSSLFGDGVIQQTFLGIEQMTGVWGFFPRQTIKHALTSVFNIGETSCKWTFNYYAHCILAYVYEV